MRSLSDSYERLKQVNDDATDTSTYVTLETKDLPTETDRVHLAYLQSK